jgi:hypothetical protein
MANEIIYQSAVKTAALCAQMLAQFDIPELLTAIERGHAFGPILDPTLYRDKAKAMNEDKELLQAANHLRELYLKHLTPA